MNEGLLRLGVGTGPDFSGVPPVCGTRRPSIGSTALVRGRCGSGHHNGGHAMAEERE